jgi:hypothetical protein
MNDLHSTYYDKQLMQSIAHLNSYPEMKPFIGSKWRDTPYKTLLLGESHFIPGNDLLSISTMDYVNDWYGANSSGLQESTQGYLAKYINTRNVINIADKQGEFKFHDALNIFYNVKSVIKTEIAALLVEPHIFPFFSFYNYFQRPAFKEGASIINNDKDNEIAYNMIKEVIKIIEPQKIIFISKKASTAFYSKRHQHQEKALFENLFIDTVPHPSCAWWNRTSKAYGNKTGKEKFSDIVKTMG